MVVFLMTWHLPSFQYMTAYEQYIYFFFFNGTHPSSAGVLPAWEDDYRKAEMRESLPNMAKLFTYHLRISETESHNEGKSIYCLQK